MKKQIEHIIESIRNESISWGEIALLQTATAHKIIGRYFADDIVLKQWAEMPER